MTWKQISKVCLQSECGTYTVAKYSTATGWKYQAWKGKAWLCLSDTAAECKQAAESDAQRSLHHHADP